MLTNAYAPCETASSTQYAFNWGDNYIYHFANNR